MAEEKNIPIEKVRKENSKHTPKEMIDKMNEKFPDWKTTEQVKYDSDGKRLN